MAKIHTIDGVQYREVAREVRYGDKYIVSLEDDLDITKGKAYKVTGIDSYGDPEFVDDAGDPNGLSEGEYVVLEPVTADPSALESELAAMKAKVAEMERQLAEVKKGAPEDRLKVGDYAKVVNTNYTLLYNFKPGDIVQITESMYGEDDCDYRIQSIVDPDTIGYAHKDRGLLVRATDEEVAEAKRKLIQPGVYVKLQIPEGSRPRYGWGNAKNGDIGKVTDRDGELVCVDFPKHPVWRGVIHEFVLATEADRKQAEEAAKWAAIGRKPGEFKTGDVVRLLDSRALGFTARSVIKDGDIGVLGEEDTDGTFRFMCKGVEYGNWVLPKRIELVAPVESVVNLRAGDIA